MSRTDAGINNGIGLVYGDWLVIGKASSAKFKCKCTTCGFEKDINKYSLEHGASLKCKHEKEDELLIGESIFDWTIIGKGSKSGKLLCKCSCGTEKEVSKARLLEGRTKSCGHNMKKAHIGMIKGDYEILEKLHGDVYRCRCTQCGDIVDKYRAKLLNDAIVDYRACPICNPVVDPMIGQVFNEWTVLEKRGDKYLCICSCNNTSLITKHSLTHGLSKSCGHNTTGLKDITGITFGELRVIGYNGNGEWLCKCSCGTEILAKGTMLRFGKTTSCGCKTYEKTLRTRLIKYGDICITKQDNPREQWQIEAVSSADKLEEYIKSLGYKPFIADLVSKLGINSSNVLKKIHKYKLEELVNIEDQSSFAEHELCEFIKSLVENTDSSMVKERDRSILPQYELDIHIPERKLAFEFNGNYWHSTDMKDKKYHQNKTLAFAQVGIRIVHIFEYEWDNNKDKIKEFISDLLCSKQTKYGRNTRIEEIDKHKSIDFLDRYHLQGSSQASIHIGCIDNKTNELLGVMTLGIPRFNTSGQYEIIRLCWKPGMVVLGGTKKLFHYFVTKYNPTHVETYSDISKFTGNVYLDLGFKLSNEPITEPGYVWVNHVGTKILSRYQTQKQRLLDAGFGDESMTEDEIMKSLDFYKIYNSGNIKLEWGGLRNAN